MIYGNKIFSMIKESKDDTDMAIFRYTLEDDAIDESSGRFDGKDKKGKSIDLMYGATNAHANVIRIKSGASSNFNNKNDFSELLFKYNSKEYDMKGARKLPSNEKDFVLGFVSRYEDALNYNARELPTDTLTNLIDADMEQFKINNSKVPKYSIPTGKVDVILGDSPSFIESNDKPSEYKCSK